MLALTDANKWVPVDRIGIVLLDMPLMLREIIRQIVADEPRLDIVAEVGEVDVLCPVIDEHRAGFVIGGDPPLQAAEVDAVLRRCPQARVLAVTPDGAQSCLFELALTRHATGELTPEHLIEVILG